MRVLELCVCYNLEEANEPCNATACCYSVMVMCCSVAGRMTMSDIQTTVNPKEIVQNRLMMMTTILRSKRMMSLLESRNTLTVSVFLTVIEKTVRVNSFFLRLS